MCDKFKVACKLPVAAEHVAVLVETGDEQPNMPQRSPFRIDASYHGRGADQDAGIRDFNSRRVRGAS
eukprot:664107-Alexandrium_andersonii.AAC.1